MANDQTEQVHYHACTLCEATCGLEIHTRGREVVSIRGDAEDVFSHGFICPKGYAMKELDADPDRLRTPLLKRNGGFTPVSWDDAFGEIDRRLTAIVERHGRDAVAVYLGNPSAHSMQLAIYNQVLLRALGTRNIYSASTVDQMPKQVAVGLMFGTVLSAPVPDIDNTDYLLILGADPFVSNGSLMTAPDAPGRLRAIRQRGGRIVVIDPRRSRTAGEASEHHHIRPGADAYFLFGIVHTLFDEGLVRLRRLAEHVNGLDDIAALARGFTPELVAARCGIAADVIRRLARELTAAERAAVYARIGTCTQEFGTLASWLVDVVNVLTGHLDQPGGALFTRPATGAPHTRGTPGRGKGVRFGRRHSRVRNAPEVYGELPAACLAEEIETPGDGQVRALITIAGNPVLSTPNGARLDAALSRLEFMLSLDIYLNETTRHADVILPGLSPFEQSHYDVAAASARHSQRRDLLAGGVRSSGRPATGVAHGAAPDRHRHRTGTGCRRRRPGRLRHRAARRARGGGAGIADSRTRRGRDPRCAGAAPRPGAPARSHAAHRPVWRRLRRPAGWTDPGAARGAPARHRLRSAHAAHSRGVAHAVGQDRAGAGAVGRPTSNACAPA